MQLRPLEIGRAFVNGSDALDQAGRVRESITLARLGARPLRQAIETLMRSARFDLTPRELEVLALLGEGMTNREIAGTLVISDKTASVHVSRILAKLSVANRASAAVLAQRLGVARADH